MKKAIFISTMMFLGFINARAQFIKFSPAGDTTRSISLEGYADIYFGFDFNQPKNSARPYFVSHARHNETNLNLAYLSVKYNAKRARATFTPGFGTYVNANYAAERATLQNIIEANVGIRLFKTRDIWIDAGVFVAPYTTESALAHDALLYTRSFAAEYSPYYLTGIRGTVPLSKKLVLFLYLVNGWQIIEDTNTPLSFGSSLEWKPTSKLTINWSSYAGNEASASQPQYRGRYFSDLYAIFAPSPRLMLSADIYAGRQRLSDSINQKDPVSWYQGNFNARYSIAKSQSVAARVEYFHDAHAVLVIPVTGLARWDCASASLGYSVAINGNVSFHAEGRYFQSGGNVFYDNEVQPTNNATLFIGGVTARF